MKSLTGRNDEDRIIVEKTLEGGVTTRSFWRDSKGANGLVGLGFPTINPNGIIGADDKDAGTTHKPKQLRPTMRKKEIYKIVDPGYWGTNSTGELATLRYEYDISKIRKRNWRRKSTTGLYSAFSL